MKSGRTKGVETGPRRDRRVLRFGRGGCGYPFCTLIGRCPAARSGHVRRGRLAGPGGRSPPFRPRAAAIRAARFGSAACGSPADAGLRARAASPGPEAPSGEAPGARQRCDASSAAHPAVRGRSRWTSVCSSMAVAVGERRRHGCLHDHPLAGGVEPVEGDGDVTREQTGEVVGEKAHDRLPADHVVGRLERDGSGVVRRREPFGVLGEDRGGPARVTAGDRLEAVLDDAACMSPRSP